MKSLLQSVFLQVSHPGYQVIDLRRDSRDLRIFQNRRHLEIVPGKFQVVLCAFPACRPDLAELAVIPGLELALAFVSQLRSQLQDCIRPFKQFFLRHNVCADILAPRLEYGHANLFYVIQAVEQSPNPQRITQHLRIRAMLLRLLYLLIHIRTISSTSRTSTDSTVCPGDKRYTCVKSPNRNLNNLVGSFTSAPLSTFTLHPLVSETLMTSLCLIAITLHFSFFRKFLFLTYPSQRKRSFLTPSAEKNKK